MSIYVRICPVCLLGGQLLNYHEHRPKNSDMQTPTASSTSMCSTLSCETPPNILCTFPMLLYHPHAITIYYGTSILCRFSPIPSVFHRHFAVVTTSQATKPTDPPTSRATRTPPENPKAKPFSSFFDAPSAPCISPPAIQRAKICECSPTDP